MKTRKTNSAGLKVFFVFISFILSSELYCQNKIGNIVPNEVPSISGGAWYNIIYQQAVHSSNNFLQNKNLQLKYSPPTVQGVLSFEGISFDANAATNGGIYSIPPDPNGAAGINYLVNIVNTSIEWYDKSGIKLNSISLKSFFSTLSPLTNCFDPKVIYDQYYNRFLVVALEQTDSSIGSPSNTSRIFLAVSTSDNPGGTWYFTSINSKLNISGKNYWADYPGLGVDSNAVYITSNLFSFAATGGTYGGSRLWIIAKNQFYSGGIPVTNIYDPFTQAGISAAEMQPAHVYGTLPANSGTFLVSYSGWHNNTTQYFSVITITNPLSSPVFANQFVNIGNVDNLSIVNLPSAPQPGTTNTIDTGDRRSLFTVWRNNSLLATATGVPLTGADAGQTTALWEKINTANINSLVKSDGGYIGGEDISTGTYTYYPSITMDSNGNIGIGFSASSSTKYAGAYYTTKLTTNPIGTVSSSVVYRNGVDYYYRTFGGGNNRWGDYSGISIDPSDNSTFWVYNEYALTRGTILNSYPSEDGRWGTAWASFNLISPTASITVSSPNGGENWKVGMVNNITWNSQNVANVKIDFSTNSGSSWTSIASSVTASPGSYAWTIPNTLTTQAKVRVIDLSDTTVGDTSNAVFTISYNRIKGDVDGNGIVQAYDASLILQYYVGLISITDPASLWAADINNDGAIDASDAASVLYYAVYGVFP